MLLLLLLMLCCLVSDSVSRDKFQSAEPITNMVTVVSGESIVLPCGVDPDVYQLHKLTTRWQQLSEDSTPLEVNDHRFSTQKDGSLLVKNVQLDDEGRYLCVDNSTLDTVAEFDIKVRKRSVVMASSEPSSGGLHEGDTLLVRCNVLTDAAGQAATLLVWRDSVLIGQHSDPRVTLVTQRGQKNSWQLVVRNVTRADAGRYICRAKTYYDSAEASIQVTVAPLVVADCTANSTKVRWSALSPSRDGYMVRLLVEERLMDAVLLASHVTSVEVQHLTAGSQVQFQVEPHGHASAMGSASCVVDGASSSTPNNGSSSPNNGNPTPNNTSPTQNNTSLPQNNTSSPQNNTSSPKNNTSSPKNNTSPPKNNTSSPKNNTSPPKNNTSSPKNNTSPPKNNTSSPKNNTSPPKNNTSPPQNNTSPPQNNKYTLQKSVTQ